MFEKIAVGTVFLAAALAAVPTAAQAQERYYQGGRTYGSTYASQQYDGSYAGHYDRDRYFDHEARERRERWERERAYREHLRRQRAREYFAHRHGYGY